MPEWEFGFLPCAHLQPQSSSPSSAELLWEILLIKVQQRWEKKEGWDRGVQGKGESSRKGAECVGGMLSDAALLEVRKKNKLGFPDLLNSQNQIVLQSLISLWFWWCFLPFWE